MNLLSQLRSFSHRKPPHARHLGRRRSRILGAELLEDRRLLAPLVNGGFETGDLSGWTTFLTFNGTIGTPEVAEFDTNGDGEPSLAAKFQVGKLSTAFGGGGGIWQSFSGEGPLQITADIAVKAVSGSREAGVFSLLIDGVVVASHDFGLIAANAIERSALAANVDLAPGVHELRIEMMRPLFAADAPVQFVDNVVVRSPNDPPVARDDSYQVDEDNRLIVNAADGVLDNDDDPDGDSLTVSDVVSGPSHGRLALGGDGSFEYVPAPDFHGQDSFVYEVSDGKGGTDTATVEITVHSVIDAVIDVKPGGDVNPINLGAKGVLPIAVLSTQIANGEADDLDAAAIDTSTITLNGVAVQPVHAALEDVDGDGDLDLVLHFRLPELVKAGVLDEDSVDLIFAAVFDGGDALGADLSGSDSVWIIPPKRKGKK